MRIVGIDPGIRVTGFGVLERNKKIVVLSYGTISPPVQKTMANRLKYLYSDAMEIIKKYKPDLLAIESTFHQKNVKSALRFVLGFTQIISHPDCTFPPISSDNCTNEPSI